MGAQQNCNGMIGLNLKSLQVIAAAMHEGMILCFCGCAEPSIAGTQPSSSASTFN